MTQTSPTLEKRARKMFEDARRGAAIYTQWYTLPEAKRAEWREQARIIEDTIAAKLAEIKE